MRAHTQRALLLLHQSRFDAAERELRQALLAEPDSAYAHAMLALCLTELGRNEEAQREARSAIGIDPEDDYGHYALAVALTEKKLEPALAAVQEAIRLNPYDSINLALLARIRLEQERWNDALEAAERGLALNPDDTTCANLRAAALRQLGRHQEAVESLQSALAENPDNPLTHTNKAWSYLTVGDSPKALDHFREALRLDPQREDARSGLVEALKAQHHLYSIFLRTTLWLSRISPGMRWTIIIGGIFAYFQLQKLLKARPDFAPVLAPVLLVLVLIWALAMAARHLFNLVLRFSREGRLALRPEQITASNWHAFILVLAVGLALLWAHSGIRFLGSVAVSCLFLLDPIESTMEASPGWARRRMLAFTLILVGLQVLSIGCFIAFFIAVLRLQPALMKPLFKASMYLQLAFLGCALASDWLAESLERWRPDPLRP